LKKILFIYGTRPEAIKVAPLIREFSRYPEAFTIEVCLTGQHREMLNQVNSFFGIKGDYDLNLMQPNQSLSGFTSRCIADLEPILDASKPDLVFVQGDTTTVLAGALSAFYKRIPIAHLEAGLRSGEKYSPYPEEINRKIVSQIAEYHFAPTTEAAENLYRDGIRKNVYIVGNTVIDALHLGLSIIEEKGYDRYQSFFSYLDLSKRIILVTGHRRESFGDGFENICNALKTIVRLHNDIEIIYPVHMNPHVREPVNRLLRDIGRIHLIEPLDYPFLLWLMKASYFIITDSGGIQEEAPALGKPVLVMRDVTERMEGIKAGTARLVGTSKESIVEAACELLDHVDIYEQMAKAVNPYGDGKSSDRIVTYFRRDF